MIWKTTVRALLLASVAGTSVVRAQATLGAEFQVNEIAIGQDFGGSLAMAPDGSFVVVWSASVSAGTDLDGLSIQARHYDSGGAALGPQFQVNSATTGVQANPAVACDADGGFLVVWNSQSSPGNDTADTSIQAQRYDSAGVPVLGQFQVNSFTTGNQIGPAVAFAETGSFVISWMSSSSPHGDTSLDSIQARRFDAAGSPLGGDFQVNVYTTGRQQWPQVGVDGAGSFVVAWTSAGSPSPGAQGYTVLTRRFGGDGLPLAGESQANTYTTGIQASPALGVRPDGSFIVVWESEGSLGSDSASFSVQARRYDSAGAALGSEFQVNTYTPSYQLSPAVAVDPSGSFVVAWASLGSPGNDALSWSVQARPFDGAGAPISEQFQVNASTTGAQRSPDVGTDGAGRFVAAWSGDPAQRLGDPDRLVFARRFIGALFVDGFESNDTSRWSAAIP